MSSSNVSGTPSSGGDSGSEETPADSEVSSGLDSTIEQVASEPKMVTGDQGSYTAQNIRDLIAADKYLASKKSSKSPKATLRNMFQRLSPPSARG